MCCRPHARRDVESTLELRSSTLCFGEGVLVPFLAPSLGALGPWRCSLFCRHPDLARPRVVECGSAGEIWEVIIRLGFVIPRRVYHLLLSKPSHLGDVSVDFAVGHHCP